MKITSVLTNLTTAILILTVQMFIQWTLSFFNIGLFRDKSSCIYNIILFYIFIIFSEILLLKGNFFYAITIRKKIIGYHLKNKSCPLPINGQMV
jgi:hypothetical protein